MSRPQAPTREDDAGTAERYGLHIQAVATMLGVSPSRLRAWEREGLVSPTRSSAGFRIYGADDIARLRRVHALIRGEGLNAAAVRRILAGEDPRASGAADAPATELTVGRRLKRLRADDGRSLRELAADCGLSASHISAIERGLSRPSVATLQRLCAALGSSIVDVLGGNAAGSEPSPIVRASEAVPVQLDIAGVEILRLSVVETQLEPLLFRLAPGAGSGEAYQHAGEEFLHVLEGEFELTLDAALEYRLRAGDSMTFASTRPHRWRNPDRRRSCVLVWVNTPRTF
jgi:transcriptional regulator with XRE-family HTH domain